MKGWGVLISTAVVCTALGFSSQTRAQSIPPAIEAQFGKLEKRIEDLERKIEYRYIYYGSSILLGLFGAIMGTVSFVSSRNDRTADRKVKAFETNYEGGVQSALQHVETCVSNLSAAAELPVPDSRVEAVRNIWVSELTPALSALTEQLFKLDESNNVPGNEWAAILDNPQDCIGQTVDVLLDETKGSKAIAKAENEFSAAARKLAETVRTKLIKHKNSLG